MKPVLRKPCDYIDHRLKPVVQIRPIKEMALRYIFRALMSLDWNVTHTSRALGMSIRTLRNHISILRNGGVIIPQYVHKSKVKLDEPASPIKALD